MSNFKPSKFTGELTYKALDDLHLLYPNNPSVQKLCKKALAELEATTFMGVDLGVGTSFSATAMTNMTTTTVTSAFTYTSWGLGVACMAMGLCGCGFYTKRLAELMYTASRVFEHNLATRARQHGMRVR